MGMSLGINRGLALNNTGGAAWSPARLLSGASQLAYYDPSDLNTLFQDSAGTTPVTADGQSVGLVLDKSGNGNHLIQSILGSRPLYGFHPATGRRNLLTFTEEFDNAAWTKTNATVTANAGVAPDGTMTADKLIESAGVTRGLTRQLLSTSVGNTISVYAKAAEWNRVCIGITNNSGLWGVAVFNLTNGTVDGDTSYGGDAVDTPVITFVGNGWYRCSVRVAAGTSPPVIMPFNQSGDPVNPSPALTGDGTSGILIWGAQLELGSTATAYQKVNTVHGVTEAGVPTVHFLRFDGTDDFLVSAANLNPGSVDKAQVFAGVRKASDAVTATIVEMSVTSDGNAGTITTFAPGGSGANSYGFGSRGSLTWTAASTQQARTGNTFPAPDIAVIAGLGDIAGDSQILRRNGTQVASNTTFDQGTGNFLSYPLYVCRRGGTSLPFNGNLYSLIVRFSAANLDAAVIDQAEAWTAGKTGVTL